jgi:PLD-like domain
VLSVALTLAISALTATLPVACMTTGTVVAVCFAPEEDCVAFVVNAIDAAERRILVTSYALTTSSGIVEALVRAKHRGVDVKLLTDRTTPCERKAGSGRWLRRGSGLGGRGRDHRRAEPVGDRQSF